MFTETLETGPIANPVVRFICRIFGHPCRVELPAKDTYVTWPDDFKPLGGGFYPDVDDLERNEIVTTQDNYSCIKIEEFKRCWCNEYFDRTYLDYEA